MIKNNPNEMAAIESKRAALLEQCTKNEKPQNKGRNKRNCNISNESNNGDSGIETGTTNNKKRRQNSKEQQGFY